MLRNLMLSVIVTAVACVSAKAGPPNATIVEVRKIWDAAPHNAFTDLAHWNGQFVCAFREGRRHVSTDGQIRVLTSTDGGEWKSAALLALEGYDLRDAGLAVAPDGRLMLIGGAAPRNEENERAATGSFVAFSRDGVEWTKPAVVVDPGRWLWRVTWHKGTAYGVAYAANGGARHTSLLASDDGTKFRTLVPKLLDAGYPTEATLRVDSNDIMYCLQRRDGQPPHDSAYLGISRPPYSDWQWHDLQVYFGGPNLLQLPSGQWIGAGRIHGPGGATTQLAWLDPEQKSLQPILKLPSGGDTSYPGLVWHDGLLWVSYYSSHEDKTNIYLATVKVE